MAVPFFHNPDFSLPLDEPQKARLAPLSFDFSAQSSYTVLASLQDVGLEGFQALWVDNSANPAPLVFVLGQSRQTVVAPPFWQGYLRVMASNQQLDFTVSCFATKNAAYGNNIVTAFPLNLMPAETGLWPAASPWGLPGTPWADCASGAASQQQITMAAITGRRSFITGLTLTAGGATAAAVLDCTLTNADQANTAKTLHFVFPIPAGVTAGAQPLTIPFAPPLPIVPGQACVLTMPSAGAGNTIQSIAAQGFYS
jgi:hypothetical protein